MGLLEDTPEFREDKRVRAEEAKFEELLRDDLRRVFCNVAGHRVLWHLFGICNLGDLSFDPDPRVTAFNEGARSVGVQLLALLETVDQDIYMKVLKEGRNIK